MWNERVILVNEWPMTKEEKRAWKVVTEFYNTVWYFHKTFVSDLILHLKFVEKGLEVP